MIEDSVLRWPGDRIQRVEVARWQVIDDRMLRWPGDRGQSVEVAR